MDLLINATSTICGHTFCERCLVEALLIKPVYLQFEFYVIII